MIKRIVFLVIVVIGLFLPILAEAQCAMCKAAVESDQTLADDVNNGIVYLMGVPYVIMLVVGFLWYRNSQKS